MKSSQKKIKTIIRFLIFKFVQDAREFCINGLDLIFSHLNGEDQELIMNGFYENVCPIAPDIEACEKGIGIWWPVITNKIFNTVLAQNLCYKINENWSTWK